MKNLTRIMMLALLLSISENANAQQQPISPQVKDLIKGVTDFDWFRAFLLENSFQYYITNSLPGINEDGSEVKIKNELWLVSGLINNDDEAVILLKITISKTFKEGIHQRADDCISLYVSEIFDRKTNYTRQLKQEIQSLYPHKRAIYKEIFDTYRLKYRGHPSGTTVTILGWLETDWGLRIDVSNM